MSKISIPETVQERRRFLKSELSQYKEKKLKTDYFYRSFFVNF